MRTYLVKFQSFLLDIGLINLFSSVDFIMSSFDSDVANGCKYHDSLQFGDICLFIVAHFEEIDQKALKLPMLLAELKLFSLEHQQRFDVNTNRLGNEGGYWLVVKHSKFKHIKNMISKQTSKYQVVGSFLLVGAHGEEGAVLLACHLFQLANVIEWVNIM